MEKIFIDPRNIDYTLVVKAARCLSGGGVVALPTETVYGLGVSSKDVRALARLREIKQRPDAKPFTLVVETPEQGRALFAPMPPFVYRLIERFWPGPLTLVYWSVNDEKIGIRVPAHIVIGRILREAGVGVFLPSANLNGQAEAVTAQDVERVFADGIDLVVDAGPSQYKNSSTVLDLTQHPFAIAREGVIPEKDIVDIFIKKRILFVCTGNTCRSPMAQFILDKYIDESKPYLRGRYEILSAGVHAYQGAGPSGHIVTLLRERENMDIRSFRATRLDRELIRSCDLIFAMEESHAQRVLEMEQTAEGRVFTLKKFLSSEREEDVADPMGQDMHGYEQAYMTIKEALVELKEWL